LAIVTVRHPPERFARFLGVDDAVGSDDGPTT